MTLETLQQYQRFFTPSIPRTPTARYVSIILVRETKSYSIFTTETGEQQDFEEVAAGLEHPEPINRLLMFKRKQVAPERRSGKALLRQYGVFPYAILYKDGQVQMVAFDEGEIAEVQEKAKQKGWSLSGPYTDCYLTEGLCTHCPDCLTYGYAAVEGEGARRARVLTDTCFTVRPYEFIQKQIKFNVIDEAKHTSGTITEYDYTLPGVFLPSIETTVDLTTDEFTYVLGNLLHTHRYGKESSRQGFLRNHVIALAFSDVELFSNLEFTQAFYDAFVEASINLSVPGLALPNFLDHASSVIERLTSEIFGRLKLITGEDLMVVLKDIQKLYCDEARLGDFLRKLNTQTATFTV